MIIQELFKTDQTIFIPPFAYHHQPTLYTFFYLCRELPVKTASSVENWGSRNAAITSLKTNVSGKWTNTNITITTRRPVSSTPMEVHPLSSPHPTITPSSRPPPTGARLSYKTSTRTPTNLTDSLLPTPSQDKTYKADPSPCHPRKSPTPNSKTCRLLPKTT